MRPNSLVFLTRSAVIAALYVALTLTPPLNAISFQQIQFRVSESLTVLAYFEPAAIPGLYLGALIANFFGSPFGAIDIFFGSFLTLAAAYLTWRIRNPLLALLPPVIINALGVALILYIAGGLPYWPSVVLVGLGEAAVVFLLGGPLLFFLLRTRVLIRQEVFNKKMGGTAWT